MLLDKRHPIILGSVDKRLKGDEVTLTDSFLTAEIRGSVKDVREAYHVGRGYFGAHLPDEPSFVFRSTKLRLGGMKEWIYTLSGFERGGTAIGSASETVPLGFYKRREPIRATVPGGSILLGLGLGANFSATEYTFKEEAEVILSPETPGSADECNERYGYALRCLMAFVSDRPQKVEQFSVWHPDAPDREIVVVGEWVQPDDGEDEKDHAVGWHEMLFTVKDVDFPVFIGKWLDLMRFYSAACNIYFGLIYGPPPYLDMTFQNVANSLHLSYERHEGRDDTPRGRQTTDEGIDDSAARI